MAGRAPEAVALGNVQRCPPYRVSGVVLGRNPVRLTPLHPTRRKAAGTQYNICQAPGCHMTSCAYYFSLNIFLLHLLLPLT